MASPLLLLPIAGGVGMLALALGNQSTTNSPTHAAAVDSLSRPNADSFPSDSTLGQHPHSGTPGRTVDPTTHTNSHWVGLRMDTSQLGAKLTAQMSHDWWLALELDVGWKTFKISQASSSGRESMQGGRLLVGFDRAYRISPLLEIGSEIGFEVVSSTYEESSTSETKITTTWPTTTVSTTVGNKVSTSGIGACLGPYVRIPSPDGSFSVVAQGETGWGYHWSTYSHPQLLLKDEPESRGWGISGLKYRLGLDWRL